MLTNKHTKPPLGLMGGSVHDWERSKDPFHADAMPDEFKSHFPNGKRREGWMALDAYGNAIGFIPDGTKFVTKSA
jgi:hypothetical protein